MKILRHRKLTDGSYELDVWTNTERFEVERVAVGEHTEKRPVPVMGSDGDATFAMMDVPVTDYEERVTDRPDPEHVREFRFPARPGSSEVEDEDGKPVKVAAPSAAEWEEMQVREVKLLLTAEQTPTALGGKKLSAEGNEL